MMYKFKLPIGDWSDDGHGKHEDYIIESNKPLQEIRELYFQACEKLGFTLDGHHELTPCRDYEEYHFKDETIEALLNFGLNISEDEQEKWVKDSIETQEFCDLVLKFIKTQDPELILTRIPSEDFPMFQFYGFDNQKRHIGYFGYGLFD
jgi:hypothetical protein